MNSWPHGPAHYFGDTGAYMVTAATYQHEHHFNTPARLTLLQDTLFRLAEQVGWHLQAWSVFSNHYHFIAISPSDVSSLQRLVHHLHSSTAREINALEQASGCQVWHQYWDTHLTYPRSYYARLHYVHHNPVKHGLARTPADYPWCSAAWFERTATPSFYKTISSFKIDRLSVVDDFHPMVVDGANSAK